MNEAHTLSDLQIFYQAQQALILKILSKKTKHKHVISLALETISENIFKLSRQTRQSFKQTSKPTYQNSITQFTSNNEPSISNITKTLNQIGEELKNIRSDLSKMDNRIGCLEEDIYEYHTYSEKDKQ